jgi:cytochrome P450
MEAQLIIATVAQKYRLRLADAQTIEPETSVTLRPRGGVRMKLYQA